MLADSIHPLKHHSSIDSLIDRAVNANGREKASPDILCNQMAQAELQVNCEHLEIVNKENAGDEYADKHEYLTGPRLLVVISIVITVAFCPF
jgi:hypothetical protein